MITQRVEANRALNNPIIKDAGFRTYIPSYAIIKKGVIRDGLKEMDLHILVRQLNNNNNNKHHHQIQVVHAYRLRMKGRKKSDLKEGK
jgi:hypothetical protein